jgi:hypothetical protein
MKFEFTYNSINHILYNHHPNLCSWMSLGWDKKIATVQYKLKDSTVEDVTIDCQANVTASEKLMVEMNER